MIPSAPGAIPEPGKPGNTGDNDAASPGTRESGHNGPQPIPHSLGSKRPMAEGPKVLVVDDEPNIRELVQVALNFHGFAVTTSATGADALQLTEAYRPDLIVLDVLLPDIDGFEVCRRLRSVANDVPVIFLTARDATADTVTGLTIGGDDYITKPFSVEALIARVRAVLRRTADRRGVLGGTGRTGGTGGTGGGTAASQADPQARLRVADLELDEDHW